MRGCPDTTSVERRGVAPTAAAALLALFAAGSAAQAPDSAGFRGQIVDSIDGDPIAGVLVRMDTGAETYTDEAGRFRFSDLEPGRRLFAMLSEDCRVAWGRVDLASGEVREARLRLPPAFGAAARQEHAEELERRRAQGRILHAAEIDRLNARSVTDLVRRLAPDMVVTAGTGQVGASSRFGGRGQASFMPDPGPVLVVDGVRAQDPGRTLDYMRPSEVAILEVLPGAAAGWSFGSSGASGAILITTRKGHATGAPSELTPTACSVPGFPTGTGTGS